jgi:hypothetical protein
MKTCVIYAASITVPEKLFVVHDFFKVFKEHFSDADFYVGLNYGSLPEQEDIIRSYVPNCEFIRMDDEDLYTYMDTSASQRALRLIQAALKAGKHYDVYWSAHTKGGKAQRDEVRQLYFDNFFSKRKEIEEMFEKYPWLGSWGLRGNARNSCGVWWKDYNVDTTVPICSNVKFTPFNYTHVNWSYIETMFALKGEPFEAFVNILDERFFTTKMDRWYWETVPAWIPSRCGFFPYIKIRKCFWDVVPDLNIITKQWIEENNLMHLLPYLSL